MRRFLSGILVALLASSPALGQARPLYKLPAGVRLQTPQGTFQGYSLEEMKTLLKMDVDLESFETQLPKIKSALESAEKAIQAQEIMLKSKDAQIDLLKQDQTRLTEKWSQENKLRHECENKPKFGSWIAWGTAAVLGATALALGITLVVKETR
jgi:hypothetical protein